MHQNVSLKQMDEFIGPPGVNHSLVSIMATQYSVRLKKELENELRNELEKSYNVSAHVNSTYLNNTRFANITTPRDILVLHELNRRFSGRGIVISVGSKVFQFSLLLIKTLRHVLRKF
jgi:hypothetical protein